jgi:Kdo2-lipid IVA lauroyltransferase/acyltransferase
MMVIYRVLDNTLLEALVKQVRTSAGNIFQPKEWALRPMLRLLKDNGIIGILIDQNVDWDEGDFVEFFGRPACTTNGLALMALRTGAPVMPVFLIRTEDRRYRMVIGDEVKIVDTHDRQADMQDNTQRFTRIIEDMVRRYPDHWLWLHQRWKTPLSRLQRKRAIRSSSQRQEGERHAADHHGNG